MPSAYDERLLHRRRINKGDDEPLEAEHLSLEKDALG